MAHLSIRVDSSNRSDDLNEYLIEIRLGQLLNERQMAVLLESVQMIEDILNPYVNDSKVQFVAVDAAFSEVPTLIRHNPNSAQ